MNDYVVVNATALKISGGLTILEQFVEAIPTGKNEYIIFTNSEVNMTYSQTNVRIITKIIKSFKGRFFWDTFGIKKWLKKNRIIPVATISLQNTNFRTQSSIPNFIYFHNAIPLSYKEWNPLKKTERNLWFYKRIYPFFIRIYINKKTEVFVQSNSLRDSFAEYFNFPKSKIHIVFPKIAVIERRKSKDPSLDQNQLNLFYPATTFIFKNHSTIIKAIGMLNKDLQQKITLHLTCLEEELPFKTSGSDNHFIINFLGKIDFSRVQQLYEEADALLFPSYIETLGLPLIEAASIGMPVIASDLPYSREALNNYSGIKFVKYDDAVLWSEEILKLFSLKGHRYPPFSLEKSNSWKELFRIIESRINMYELLTH